MKKSMIGFALALIALALLLPAGGLAEISGSGTEGDPYIVNDFYELETVTNTDYDDPTTPVYVRLGDNVTGSLWDITQRTVVLDLNGKTLSRPSDFTGEYNGSVICILGNGSLTLEDSVGGGTITGGYCTADDGGFGGGVTLLGGSPDDFCTLIMKGGTITGNKAVNGGAGVHVKINSTFIMEGGEITGNMNSGDSTGGVCAFGNGVIRISGAPKIRGNYAGSGEGAKESNVFLTPGSVIQIGERLEAGASIGVTMSGGTGVFTSGLPGKGSEKNFTSDNPNYTVTLTDQEEAQLGVVYSVVSGDGQTWIRGTGNSAGASFTFRGSPSDANTYRNFTGIRVDGKAVGEEDYTAKQGSVVIGLKAPYLEGLADGSHTLTAVFTDGEADAGFTIKQSPGKKPADGGDMPRTGDGSQPLLWGLLAAACAGAVAAIRIRRKKK